MNHPAFDYFDLKPPVTEAALKTAYRQRARQLHPDKGGDTAAFQTLQAYYQQAQCALQSVQQTETHLFSKLDQIQREAEELTHWFYQQAQAWAERQADLTAQLQANEQELAQLFTELEQWQTKNATFFETMD